MNKHKLLIINGNQFGYSVGHFFYCKYLKDEYNIEYICFDRNRKKLDLCGINVHYISFSGNKYYRILRFLLSAIKICWFFKPDILLIVQFKFCHLLALMCKSPMKILDIRTGSLAKSDFRRYVQNRFILFQSLFYNKKIILSDSLRKKLQISNRNTLVLPLGSEVFSLVKHDYSTLNLLYVGAFNRRNIDHTVDGLGIFLKNNPEAASKVRYIIIGFGPDQEINKISKAIEKNNIKEIVSYEGFKNYYELPYYFGKCNIGVAYVPITDYYNCQPSTKIYEYALSGIFTIATNTLENQTAISYENGILCKDTPESFSEALEKIYNNRSNINEIDIRQSLVNHRWDLLVKNTLEPFLNK